MRLLRSSLESFVSAYISCVIIFLCIFPIVLRLQIGNFSPLLILFTFALFLFSTFPIIMFFVKKVKSPILEVIRFVSQADVSSPINLNSSSFKFGIIKGLRQSIEHASLKFVDRMDYLKKELKNENVSKNSIQLRLDLAEKERDSANQALEQMVDAMKKLAAGDFGYRSDNIIDNKYQIQKNIFNESIDKLAEIFGRVASSVATIASGSSEIALASDDLARRTERQAANLGETAASVNTVTVGVQKTAQAALDARKAAGGARDEATESGAVMKSTIEAMREIEDSSKKVADILGVIDEIAFQTNLLALNAGVEAARAGDAGRGFAVVATEVRSLAQRSAASAKDVKELILLSGRQVSRGVTLVTQTSAALSKISHNVGTISSLIEDISSSAHQQAENLTEINRAIGEMDQTTQQNAAMVEQTTAASHNLTRETRDLENLVGDFHMKDHIRSLGQKTKQTKSLVSFDKIEQKNIQKTKHVDSKIPSDDGWEDF
ncbi:methyl-accepting chemotaxis protein [Acetobacter sacchari]|uniref:Methyl-accepting chemotaxis protein n=1 Tax=Acetobacter sacchari TaxID=2661687 RepID=A0ABS3LY19_9PROT|nr:methyl-accepting chemotaxis protein [Acetobacter sacchari]MBO1360804.1 methyl-accepting chemotaxis protein [Acetobacter sacchari]